jgi:uncharacterized repeat protein (TIGR03803 family)
VRLLMMACFACFTVADARAASGQEITIYSFCATPGDACEPFVGLTVGPDGAFYGISSTSDSTLDPTIFRATVNGTVTVLFRFHLAEDGFFPRGRLFAATDGLLYGTVADGGAAGKGSVFKVSTLGVYSRLFDFGDFPSDGRSPEDGVTEGPDGLLYGTTLGGGLAVDGGTVFRISKSGQYEQLHKLGSGPDGKWPFAGLTFAGNGKFYGTTFFSGPFGTGEPARGGGTVFSYNPGGAVTTLYDFHAGKCDNDGAAPEARLITGLDGNLYGVTREGGKFGRGTIFMITTAGRETVLYSFGEVANDGREPSGRLLQLADGTLLGTTRFGGAYESAEILGGTAFMLAPDGTYSLLHSFGGTATGGVAPWDGLTLGPDGGIYGTTAFGGATTDRSQQKYGHGTVFKLLIDAGGSAPSFRTTPLECGGVEAAAATGSTGGGKMGASVLLVAALGILARRKRGRPEIETEAGYPRSQG